MLDTELKKILTRLEEHEKRIRVIEENVEVVRSQKAISNENKGKKNYSGATGGTRQLIDGGFFKSKRDLTGIREELANNSYHYSSQAIHEALKGLAKPGGPLISLRDGQRKTYVERK